MSSVVDERRGAAVEEQSAATDEITKNLNEVEQGQNEVSEGIGRVAEVARVALGDQGEGEEATSPATAQGATDGSSEATLAA